MSKWRRGLALAVSEGVPARAFVMALVIGTILNIINQGDVLLHGGALNWLKIALSYLTPYLVSTHGAVAARLHATGGTS